MNRQPTIAKHDRAGFTLLEIIVVLTVIAIISAGITPVYAAVMDGIRVRNTRNDIVAVLRFAQETAVRESREHRVYFDRDAGTYRLARLAGLEKDEKVFEAVDGRLGAAQPLPETMTFDNIKARRDRRSREHFVACLPNGASDNATIRLRNTRSRGGGYTITVEGPLGKITAEESR